MDKLKFLLKILILFLLFIPQISLAKSTNKNKFMNEYNKAVDLLKSEKKLTINSFQIFARLENNYDLSKINLKKNIEGNYFFYLCDGYAIFKKQEQQKIISFCLKADKIFLNQNYYERKNWSYVKYHLADLIGMYSAWRYYFYGDKKDLRVAKKYIERNKVLKKTDKFKDIYINNLKNQSILYRANLNIKKAIRNHEDILDALNCFNNRELQKKRKVV